MKNFKQFSLIKESSDRVLISVDIQPEYQSAISFSIESWIEWLQETDYSKYILLYNGPELGMINESEYKYWLFEHGMSEEFMDSCIFYDKTYAFFRSCMDEGYGDDLVDIIQYMWKNDITDSRDIDEDQWKQLNIQNKDLETYLQGAEMITIPDIMYKLDTIHRPIDVVGGGTNECLEEIRLALTALNKSYRNINKWIY
jgi:hypothetical protein